MADTPSSLSKLEDALTGIEDFMRGMGPSSAQLSGTAEAQAVASTVLAAESSQPDAAKAGMPPSVSSTSISGMSVDEEVESLFKGLGIKHSESIDPSLSLSKHQLNVDDDPSEVADTTPIPTVQEPLASDKPATEAPEMRRPAAGNSLAVVEEVTKKRQSLLIDDELTVDEQSHLSRADASASVPANDLRPEDLAAMRHGTIRAPRPLLCFLTLPLMIALHRNRPCLAQARNRG